MKHLACIALSLLIRGNASGQNRISDHNAIGWFSTVITPAISKKAGLHAEYQWRRSNIVSDWQQSLIRVGINYKVHSQIVLHAGYGYVGNEK
jgi:hypothetical protein